MSRQDHIESVQPGAGRLTGEVRWDPDATEWQDQVELQFAAAAPLVASFSDSLSCDSLEVIYDLLRRLLLLLPEHREVDWSREFPTLESDGERGIRALRQAERESGTLALDHDYRRNLRDTCHSGVYRIMEYARK